MKASLDRQASHKSSNALFTFRFPDGTVQPQRSQADSSGKRSSCMRRRYGKESETGLPKSVLKHLYFWGDLYVVNPHYKVHG